MVWSTERPFPTVALVHMRRNKKAGTRVTMMRMGSRKRQRIRPLKRIWQRHTISYRP
jgi:hypothetical protein